MSGDRTLVKVEVYICRDTLQALPMLAESYGVSGTYALNQALDIWVGLARRGLLGRVFEVRCAGKQPGTMHFPVPKQPEDVVEEVVTDLFL
jgi:hypothetical protein